jgi:hypothetical protein
MSAADLTNFLAETVDEPMVRGRLLPLRGADFAAALIAVAAERGHTVTAEDVESAVRDGRRAWWERWV